MKRILYVCTHCSNRFESEEKEILECPKCFWSTSVKKAEDLKSPQDLRLKKKTPAGRQAPLNGVFHFKGLFFLLLAGAAAAGLFFGWPILKSALLKKRSAIEISKPGAEEKANKAKPSDLALGEKTAAQPQWDRTDLSRLEKRITVDPGRAPNAEELKVLNRRTSFKTGLVERLPSQIWTLEQFETLLEEQQAFYKVKLPRRYRKELVKSFSESYLLSREPFAEGRLLEARNYWIKGLVFPIYEDNIQKHRGVVLTMLRTYINDTLSKISVANNVLVEKDLRENEEALNRAYGELFALVEARDWPASLAKIETLKQRLETLQNPRGEKRRAPAYPPEAAKIDADIQATLGGFYEVPLPAVADFGPLHDDLLEKKKVIESFLPAFVETNQRLYAQALEAIGRRDWGKAKSFLAQIQGPEPLKRDAAEKIKILDKLRESFA